MANHSSENNNHRLRQIEQMLLDNPTDSFLQHALALEFTKLGDLAAAKNTFEQLLSNDEHYVGSYYHLAKLYEKLDLLPQAKATYEKGIIIATQQKNTHAASELRSALEQITEDDW
jgi:Tfp pilus assembly protein PilF